MAAANPEPTMEVEQILNGSGEEQQTLEFGNCLGPDSLYVKLISSDGHEFILKRKHAYGSGTLKVMFNGPEPYANDEVNEVALTEMPSHVLKRVAEYLPYKTKYTFSPVQIPEFNIDLNIVIELTIASNFLDC